MSKWMMALLLLAGMGKCWGTVLFDGIHKQCSFSLWKPDTQQAAYTKEGLRISWNTGANNIMIITFPSANTPLLQKFDQARCTVELELPENSPVKTFSLRFSDAKKEIFQWRVPVKIKKAGRCVLQIPMTESNIFWRSKKEKGGSIEFPIRLLSCCASAAKNVGEAALTLKTISFQNMEKSSLSDIRFDLHLDNPARVLVPGSGKKVTLKWTNPTSSELRCTADLTLRHIDGDTIKLPAESLVLPPKESVSREIALPLPKLGLWYVTSRLSGKEKNGYAETNRSLAYMTPAGADRAKKSDDFIFGVCIPTWTRPKEFDKEAQTAALCGATALRLNFRWFRLERQKGKFDFTNLEKIRDCYAKYNIELMPIVSNPPVWARSDPENGRSLPEYTQWRAYINLLLTRYGRDFRFWEVWNEPELYSFCTFSAPEYLALMKFVREEQRRVAPNVKILTGGFATIREHRGAKPGFQQYVLEHGRDLFDIHAYHGHGIFSSYAETLTELLFPIRRRYNITAPWFANETAISSFRIGEMAQAETLFKKFLYTWSTGAIGYNWYNLRNNGNTPHPEHNYGLVTQEYYPKANYVTYNLLATFFRGGKFVSRPKTTPGIWILNFASGDGHNVAVWNEEPLSTSDEPAVFRTDATGVEKIDLMGNRKPLALENGTLIHRIGPTPEVLRFHGAKTVRYLGALVRSQTDGFVAPGRKVQVTLRFRNPFDRDITFRYTLSAPDGVALHPANGEVTLPPGTEKNIDATLTAQKINGLRSVQMRLQWDDHEAKLKIPLLTAIFVPRNRSGEIWDFVLNRLDQVKSLYPADPGNAHRLWNGPEDLSAKLCFSVNNGNIILDLRVTDDKHVQPHRGVESFLGDSVQLAFAIPGQKDIWVIGAARLQDGTSECFVWDNPAGFDKKAFPRQCRLKTARK
ncbi:MAG: hypothetical protein PHS41_11980, partial [Victivallaceae bacterium]|nr:hypothetical protein [Victivallaceae bacterium]